MPELPEVEVLVRYLRRVLPGQTIRRLRIRRVKVLGPTPPDQFRRQLGGCRFQRITRRGKYLLFHLAKPGGKGDRILLGHLGMTGRIYLQPPGVPHPKHTAILFHLDHSDMVFEDTRYFGRMTLDTSVLNRLGPEPLAGSFTCAWLLAALSKSRQAIKIKLLDQQMMAGVGNIYASEALFRARIHPEHPADQLSPAQVRRLWRAVREVLREAIRGGSTVPLDWTGALGADRLFYFGRAAGADRYYEERLRVYDRAGQPCPRCQSPIRRIVQGARSTFYCPTCQRGKP